MKIKKKQLDFIALLIYSIIPGISKIYGIREMLVMNVIIIIYFLISSKTKMYKKDLIYILLLFYIGIQSIIAIIFFPINILGFFMGIYTIFLPMLGYILARDTERDEVNLIISIRNVAFIHAIIGVILYPIFPFYKYFIYVFEKLNDGVMAGRMASVSGSLGFAVLMGIGLSIQFFFVFVKKKKDIKELLLLLLFICTTFLSLQRSAWLAMAFNVLFLIFLEFKKKRISIIAKAAVVFAIGSLIILKFKSDLIVERISNFGFSAILERNDMWLGSIRNFLEFPSGIGLGQVGQVARYAPNAFVNGVSDGDYFRILSEMGLIGIFAFIIFLLIQFIGILKCKKDSILIVCIMVLNCFYIAMIGSNVTEFYFVNYLFWFFLGLSIKRLRIGM